MTHAESAKRRRQLANAVLGGKTPAAVARRFNLSSGTVIEACREHNVPLPPTAGQETRSKRNTKIANAVRKGVPLPELCQRFKVIVQTVRDVARAEDLKILSNYDSSLWAKRHPFEVLTKLKAGWSDARIGRECSLTPTRVSVIKKHARKLGLL